MDESGTSDALMGKLAEERASRRRFLRVFGSPDGLSVLSELERKFEVNLPAFQGSIGSFDPFDAMRRDSYREVFLFLRHKLEMARSESGGEEINEEYRNSKNKQSTETNNHE